MKGGITKGLREQKFVGTAQLAEEASRLLSRLVPHQERQSVSLVPDERTVRYYSAEGLLSPPEGKQGLNSVYGYQHLLQLLVIKRLQAEHLSIRKIRELVDGKSADELENLLEVNEPDEAGGSKNAATRYLESLIRRPAGRAQVPAAAPATLSHISPSSAWSRIEVEPGLELHLRDDYRLPDDVRERQRLARKILDEIEQHGPRPGK